MPAPFAYCAAYAFGLALLIFSHVLTWAALDRFLARPYALGTHTVAWMDWLGAGCAFVGLVNVLAARSRLAAQRRDAALATAAIFGAWFAQNLALMFSGRFTPLMWVNVAGCLVAAAWSLAWLARGGDAARVPGAARG